VEMDPTIELDDVRARGKREAQHPERVRTCSHALSIDRRLPAAVVCLAHDEVAGCLSLDAPVPETTRCADRGAASRDRRQVTLERRPINAVRRRRQVGGRRYDDRPWIARGWHLVDPDTALVEDHR